MHIVEAGLWRLYFGVYDHYQLKHHTLYATLPAFVATPSPKTTFLLYKLAN